MSPRHLTSGAILRLRMILSMASATRMKFRQKYRACQKIMQQQRFSVSAVIQNAIGSVLTVNHDAAQAPVTTNYPTLNPSSIASSAKENTSASKSRTRFELGKTFVVIQTQM